MEAVSENQGKQERVPDSASLNHDDDLSLRKLPADLAELSNKSQSNSAWQHCSKLISRYYIFRIQEH